VYHKTVSETVYLKIDTKKVYLGDNYQARTNILCTVYEIETRW